MRRLYALAVFCACVSLSVLNVEASQVGPGYVNSNNNSNNSSTGNGYNPLKLKVELEAKVHPETVNFKFITEALEGQEQNFSIKSTFSSDTRFYEPSIMGVGSSTSGTATLRGPGFSSDIRAVHSKNFVETSYNKLNSKAESPDIVIRRSDLSSNYIVIRYTIGEHSYYKEGADANTIQGQGIPLKFLHKNGTKVISRVFDVGSGKFVEKGTYAVSRGTWKLDHVGWWYQYGNGGYAKDAWEEINSGDKKYWYYFDQIGYMKKGWQKVHDKWYYLYEQAEAGQPEGSMAVDTVIGGYKVGKDGVWISN